MKTSAFHKVDDYKKLFTAAALGYVPHLTIIANEGGAKAVGLHLAIISAVALSINIPYLREIPLLIPNLINRIQNGKMQKPSARITALFNEVAAKAERSDIKLYQYDGTRSYNAFAFKNDVYIGTELAGELSDDQLKGVVAHEVSHQKTRDLSVTYLIFIPYLSSIVDLVTRIPDIVQQTSEKNLTAAFGAAAISAAYYKYSEAVYSFGSRVLEYRADRNAVNLTGDPDAYQEGLLQLLSDDDLNQQPYKALFRTHPTVFKRMDAISKEFPETKPVVKISKKTPT